jgi:hypothetical protein
LKTKKKEKNEEILGFILSVYLSILGVTIDPQGTAAFTPDFDVHVTSVSFI